MKAYVVETTAAGTGAIAVLEVVGPGAQDIFARAFGPRALRADSPLHTAIADEAGELDDVVVAFRPPEASMTGWPHVEIQCHGSPAIVKRVRRTLVRVGAIPAPRTFLLRTAVRNRKMTRLEEEAWLAATGALTERAANELWEQRVALPALARQIGQTRDRALLDKLLVTWMYGNALASPRRVAVLGAPNTGKSTLVNALAGRERVLVSSSPGTTRDVVEVRVSIDGIPVVLVDTAGLRESFDPIEQRGVANAWREAARASLRVICLNGPHAFERLQQSPSISIMTKADLPHGHFWREFEVSAITGLGLDTLRETLLERLHLSPPSVIEGAFLFTARQWNRARDLLDAPDSEWQERWERWVWGRARESLHGSP